MPARHHPSAQALQRARAVSAERLRAVGQHAQRAVLFNFNVNLFNFNLRRGRRRRRRPWLLQLEEEGVWWRGQPRLLQQQRRRRSVVFDGTGRDGRHVTPRTKGGMSCLEWRLVLPQVV